MLNYYDLGIVSPTMNHLSPENSSKIIADSELPVHSAPKKPCCLIFAADENIRILYKTLLEIWNYEVIEATTSEEVIRQIAHKCPDIILMDTQINFSASLSTMTQLKAAKSLEKIPFILLSGHAQSKIRSSAIAAGATDFCVKPVDFNLLEKILKNCLNYSN